MSDKIRLAGIKEENQKNKKNIKEKKRNNRMRYIDIPFRVYARRIRGKIYIPAGAETAKNLLHKDVNILK